MGPRAKVPPGERYGLSAFQGWIVGRTTALAFHANHTSRRGSPAGSSPAQAVVPHPAPALITRGVRELLRGGQIEGRPLDPGPPRLAADSEPATRRDAVATGNDIEVTAADIDDLGRAALGAEPADEREQRVVETERVDSADPVRVIDQVLTDCNDRVHHRMPATPEIAGDIGNCATVRDGPSLKRGAPFSHDPEREPDYRATTGRPPLR